MPPPRRARSFGHKGQSQIFSLPMVPSRWPFCQTAKDFSRCTRYSDDSWMGCTEWVDAGESVETHPANHKKASIIAMASMIDRMVSAPGTGQNGDAMAFT